MALKGLHISVSLHEAYIASLARFPLLLLHTPFPHSNFISVHAQPKNARDIVHLQKTILYYRNVRRVRPAEKVRRACAVTCDSEIGDQILVILSLVLHALLEMGKTAWIQMNTTSSSNERKLSTLGEMKTLTLGTRGCAV